MTCLWSVIYDLPNICYLSICYLSAIYLSIFYIPVSYALLCSMCWLLCCCTHKHTHTRTHKHILLPGGEDFETSGNLNAHWGVETPLQWMTTHCLPSHATLLVTYIYTYYIYIQHTSYITRPSHLDPNPNHHIIPPLTPNTQPFIPHTSLPIHSKS
jgi:hypothetical protein